MDPVLDAIAQTLGDSIVVEIGTHTSAELSTKIANDLVFYKPINAIIPIHSKRLETTGVTKMLIMLKYKHIREVAALGYYRGSVHEDRSLYSSVRDYLAREKGWFSPYLYASARVPAIPRTIKSDIVICHGPFLTGDYRVGQTLLAESKLAITLCDSEPASPIASPNPAKKPFSSVSKNTSMSPPPTPQPRRLIILLVGLKPHRVNIWASSKRPGESVINYLLCDGCPTVVVPMSKMSGAPLLAWNTLTLKQLWEIKLPEAGTAMGTTSDG
ncbi:hypothetical protein H0H92_009170, partial [Tricholoma furcatifolium]